MKKVIFKYLEHRYGNYEIYQGDDDTRRIGSFLERPFLYSFERKILFTDDWPEEELALFFSITKIEARHYLKEWFSQKFEIPIEKCL